MAKKSINKGTLHTLTAEQVRREGATYFMGPGFVQALEKKRGKSRAYEFWYHPITELLIFLLILVSILLLVLELLSETPTPGWIGGLVRGESEGWFFYVDLVITFVFLMEYLFKLWIAPRGRKWFFVRHSWIELLAVLPIFRFFRLFRLARAFRMFRVFRILRSIRLLRTGQLLSKTFQSFSSDLERNRSANSIIITYFFCTLLFSTLGILVFEQGVNEDLTTFGDGLWWAVVTLSTVGYGDIVPVTEGGRLIAGLVVLMGLGLWSLVTGVVATTFMHRLREKERLGLDLLGVSRHIIICGWNSNGLRLIEDFRALRPERHIVIVSERDAIDVSLDSRIHILRLNPLETGALSSAQITEADAIVLLASTHEEAQKARIDASTILLAMRCRKAGYTQRLIAEVLLDENRKHALQAGTDAVVASETYAGVLLSQSMQSPKVGALYRELFEIESKAHFQEILLPPEYEGLEVSRVTAQLFEDLGVVLTGLRRGADLAVPPRADVQLTKGDILLVLTPKGLP